MNGIPKLIFTFALLGCALDPMAGASEAESPMRAGSFEHYFSLGSVAEPFRIETLNRRTFS